MTFNLLSQLTDRSTNKEDEDEGSPVDDVGVGIDDESNVNFDVEVGEGDGLRLDSSDDDESECRSRSRSRFSPSPTVEPQRASCRLRRSWGGLGQTYGCSTSIDEHHCKGLPSVPSLTVDALKVGHSHCDVTHLD
ncbi:hypothetical protein PoB_005036900 [Plakobranchus ocellatus]|uniref:Uncharacterized protein n=1 Tax=Plakobranchus ocellatus TaxID=259542 RepID=A0AAV4BZN2_9GAST|nr:hypothetical protein PoB_005036900 [Plakobranchus ocellatus]